MIIFWIAAAGGAGTYSQRAVPGPGPRPDLPNLGDADRRDVIRTIRGG